MSGAIVRWTPAEDAALEAHLAAGLDKHAFAAISGRTYTGVRHRAVKLGLGTYTRFSKEEDWRMTDLLSRRWSYERIGEDMGRSAESIKWRAWHMGIIPTRDGVYSATRAAKILGITPQVMGYFCDIGLIRSRRSFGQKDRMIRLIEKPHFEEWLLKPKNWRLFDTQKITDPDLREVVLEAQGVSAWKTAKKGA